MNGRTAAGIGAIIAFIGAATIRVEASIPPSQALEFAILRDTADIGRHSVAFRRDGEDLHVAVDIDIAVELLFVTVFRFRHSNREVWRDGRLVAIDTVTDDDGTPYFVRGRATAGGFAVESSAGRYTAPADVVPSSYWNVATTGRTQLLDTRRGRLVAVTVTPQGRDTVATAAGAVDARRFAVDGELRLTLWYTPEGTWVKTAFRARGERVEYRLRDVPDTVRN